MKNTTKLKEAVEAGLGIKWKLGGPNQYMYIILWGPYTGIWEHVPNRGYQRREISSAWYVGVSHHRDGHWLPRDVKAQASRNIALRPGLARGTMIKLLRAVHKNIPSWVLKIARCKEKIANKYQNIPIKDMRMFYYMSPMTKKLWKQKREAVKGFWTLTKYFGGEKNLRHLTKGLTKETLKKVFRWANSNVIKAAWIQWSHDRKKDSGYMFSSYIQGVAEREFGITHLYGTQKGEYKYICRLVKNQPGGITNTEARKEINRLWGDCKRMIRELRNGPISMKNLQATTRKRELDVLHNQLIALLNQQHEIPNQHLAQQQARLFQDDTLPKEYKSFPHQMIPELTQLSTEDMLIEEGIEMNHCVGSYRWEASKGESWFFKYQGEARGTLMIKEDKVTKYWRIIQFFGKYNKPMPTKDWDAITAWINQLNNQALSIETKQLEANP